VDRHNNVRWTGNRSQLIPYADITTVSHRGQTKLWPPRFIVTHSKGVITIHPVEVLPLTVQKNGGIKLSPGALVLDLQTGLIASEANFIKLCKHHLINLV
jgi:hypothetical protein